MRRTDGKCELLRVLQQRDRDHRCDRVCGSDQASRRVNRFLNFECIYFRSRTNDCQHSCRQCSVHDHNRQPADHNGALDFHQPDSNNNCVSSIQHSHKPGSHYSRANLDPDSDQLGPLYGLVHDCAIIYYHKSHYDRPDTLCHSHDSDSNNSCLDLHQHSV